MSIKSMNKAYSQYIIIRTKVCNNRILNSDHFNTKQISEDLLSYNIVNGI